MKTRPPSQRTVRFCDLSLPQQRLVRLFQAINFGALRGLQIREREPVFEPQPVLLADVKLDGDSVARPELDLADFVLRDEVITLMNYLDQIVNTTLESLEVHAGNPKAGPFHSFRYKGVGLRRLKGSTIMKPAILPLDPVAIPTELRDISAWIGWKLVQRDGRWSKEPVTIHNGALAETDNPATWCNFQTAVEGYKRLGCDGIGLCRNGDLVFLDLDGVLDSTGGLKPFLWASKILSTVEGRAYIEKSPTGTGIHAICRGRLSEGRRQFDLPDAYHTGFAFYDRSRFFTFTGSVLPQSGAIQVLTPLLASLHRELFPPKASVNGSHDESPLSLTDSELLERARRAANGPGFSRL
jgi:hypothetical protein